MEAWKDIPGYEGIYEASMDGRIRTKEGKTTSNARYNVRVWKQRELKQKLAANKKGRTDARVCLWKDGKEKTFLVSRLIAMTWVDGYAPDMTVNHIDGNPLNNAVNNLEWLPLGDNIRHGFKSGLFRSNQIPVVVVENGVISVFDSMSEASKHLGKNDGYISDKLAKRRRSKV